LWNYVGSAILLLLCCMSCAWLVWKRRNQIVVNAQGPLLVLMVLGCALSSLSLVFLATDDSSYSLPSLNTFCMLTPILFILGFQLIFVTLAIKSWRVLKLFSVDKLQIIPIPTRQVFGIIGLIIFFELFLIGIWSGVAPLVWQRSVTVIDQHGSPLGSTGFCVAPDETSFAFLVLFFAIHFASMAFCTSVLFKIRHVPVEFQEASWMLYALASVMQIFIVAALIFLSVQDVVAGRFIVCFLAEFFSVLIVLFMMIVPKVYLVHTGRKLWQVEPVSMLGRLRGSNPANGMFDYQSHSAVLKRETASKEVDVI